MAPQGRGSPFAPAGEIVRPAIGKVRAHVVHQQIGVGMDGLVRELRQWRILAGPQFRDVAGDTVHLAEHLFAAGHFRIIQIPARGRITRAHRFRWRRGAGR